jgi:nodulation protein E
MTRVAITGIGIVSPLGRGVDAHVEAVATGRSGIRKLQNIDASKLSCRIGGEVSDEFLGDDFKDGDRFVRLALLAASDAVQASRLHELEDRTRIASLIGTGLGGSETLDAAYLRLYGQNNTRIHPMSIPRAMYNAAASAVSAQFQALGPSYAIVSACASGAHAIGQAAHWIRNGLADAALAGGADAPLVPGIIRGWEALRVLAPTTDDPASACRPFSATRRGIVLAEGAAVLILESFDSAIRRGVEILGEVAGFGLTSDAGHVTDPSSDGAARAMTMALRDGNLEPQQIDYVNAHGTATRANDPTETKALKEALGERAFHLPVSSTKSMHGHAMGASGAIETALSLASLNAGWIPPTLNLDDPDPACDLDYVPKVARRGDVSAFLSNSFGFGGMNGVLAVRTRRGVEA